MRIARRIMAIATGGLLLASSAGAGGLGGGAGVPEWAPGVLVDHWRAGEGGALIVEEDGRAKFVGADGNLLQEAEISILSFVPAMDTGLQLIHVATFALTVDDTTYVVPGYYSAGEGEAPSLVLYVVPSPLAARLDRWYGLDGQPRLRMRGTPPP